MHDKENHFTGDVEKQKTFWHKT